MNTTNKRIGRIGVIAAAVIGTSALGATGASALPIGSGSAGLRAAMSLCVQQGNLFYQEPGVPGGQCYSEINEYWVSYGQYDARGHLTQTCEGDPHDAIICDDV